MIVVDTNIVVYAIVESPLTRLARRVRELDPEWRIPVLWRHEFLNVLANILRRGTVRLAIAERLWSEAVRLVGDSEQEPDWMKSLSLAAAHGVTAYDAEFIALAQSLGVVCVTHDQALLRAFPRETRSMEEFCAA